MSLHISQAFFLTSLGATGGEFAPRRLSFFLEFWVYSQIVVTRSLRQFTLYGEKQDVLRILAGVIFLTLQPKVSPTKGQTQVAAALKGSFGVYGPILR